MSLFEDASLVLTPNGYKASKLYSIKPTSGAGDMVVSRGTTATRVNSAGLIESVAINVPRLDYTGGGCPSILVEPLRTNSVLYSNDLSQSVWSKANYALTSATSIQGLTTTRITKNATDNGAYNGTGGRNVQNTIGTFAAGTKTLTWLIRKGNTDKVGFLINNVLVGVLTSVSCEFDFTTQTFTNISLGLTASFENPTTDVYKIILTINDIGVSTSKRIWIAPIDNSNNTVTGGYLDFAFAQWELGSNATSYIPTVAATVTRNADVISKTGVSSLIGQTEGTLYAEINITTFNNGVFFSINDGTSGNRIQMYKFTDNKIYCDRISATQSVTTSINSSALSVGTYKVAFAYQSGNSYLYINGAQVGATSAATFTFGSMGKVNIGSRFDDTSTFNDRIELATLFPTRLSPGQLATLTTL